MVLLQTGNFFLIFNFDCRLPDNYILDVSQVVISAFHQVGLHHFEYLEYLYGLRDPQILD